MTVAIRYVVGPRLTRSLLAAAATAGDLAEAFHRGVHRLRDSDSPREGSRLTVARASAQAARRAAADSPDISLFMTRLPFAGESAAEGGFQYCTEEMGRAEQWPVANEIRVQIRNFGGSVRLVLVADTLKIHVHADAPEAVFTFAARWGRIPAVAVANSSADLPGGVLDRHHIALVPLQVMFGDATFRNRVELIPEDFNRSMRVSKALPVTSQPSPGEFGQVLRVAA